jgi:hypothetical protein
MERSMLNIFVHVDQRLQPAKTRDTVVTGHGMAKAWNTGAIPVPS